MTPLFDFEQQYVKYGEFHFNRYNEMIHMVFVPAILWTVQVWLAFPLLGVTPAAFITTLYLAYYLSLWPQVALLYTPFLALSCYSAQYFSLLSLPYLSPKLWALLLHVISWIFQILGHKLFEGRAPALLKDPLQAFILAPLFVFLQYLFMFGLFKGTEKRLIALTKIKVTEYRKSIKKVINPPERWD